MPLPARHGLSEVRTYIDGVFSAFAVEIDTLAVASSGSFVFTERIDHLRLHATGAHCPPPIAGVVEMRDGKIAKWRDYLDVLTAEAGLGIRLRPEA